MDWMLERGPKSGPILSTTLIVGGVSFVLGYTIPLIVSDSNLGPFWGIFVTGPLGLLAGVLIGTILSAKQDGQEFLARELRWLAVSWAGALLFTLASAVAGISLFAIAAQFAVVICAATLLYAFSKKLPLWARRWRELILIGAALTVLSSIYPPLDAASAGEARYGFFLDARFDASTNVPDYSVSQSMLLLQWLIIAGAVVLPILVQSTRNKPEAR